MDVWLFVVAFHVDLAQLLNKAGMQRGRVDVEAAGVWTESSNQLSERFVILV